MNFFKKRGPEPNGLVTIEESTSTIKRLLNALAGEKGRVNLQRIKSFLDSLEFKKNLPDTIEPTPKSKDELTKSLIDSGVAITDWANNFINQTNFEILGVGQDLLVQYVSPRELGIEKRVTLEQFFKIAHEKKLQDLPISAALYLAQSPHMVLKEIFFSGSLNCEQDIQRDHLHVLRLSFYNEKISKRVPGKNLELVRIASDRWIEPDVLVAFEE